MAEKDNSEIIVKYSAKELFEKLGDMEDKLFHAINKLDTKFDRAMNGNGKKGVKDRLTTLETTVRVAMGLIILVAGKIIVELLV